jgi:hypothetical protein
MTREPFQATQIRLLAKASVPYRDWIRALCDRCGIAWRERYAIPIDDKPQRKEIRNG